MSDNDFTRWQLRAEMIAAHRMDAPDYMPAGSIEKHQFELEYWYASPTMFPREESEYEEDE